MSVESIAIALHHSRATGTAKVVLLGIANHDGDGGAWPSVDTLARYANVSRRNVQNAIARLVELREIQVLRQAGGDHSVADSHRPNLYRVTLRCPPTCDRTTRHRQRSGAPIDLIEPLAGGVSESTPGDDIDAGGVSEPTPKPPLNQISQVVEVTTERAHVCATGHLPDGTGWCLRCSDRVEVAP